MAPLLTVDATLIRAWLTARSLARGLPPPVADRGGFRVETESEKELRRWVFASAGPGLRAIGRAVTEPRNLIKLCAGADVLRDELPPRWQVEDGSWFMACDGDVARAVPLPAGYRLRHDVLNGVTSVSIFDNAGGLAASGYGAESGGVFVYDRIVTEPGHRRRGLGRALMAAIGTARASSLSQQILVASSEGERLYSALGWRIVSPYATAQLPEPEQGGCR